MAEWTNAAVLKIAGLNGPVGSNPTLTANFGSMGEWFIPRLC